MKLRPGGSTLSYATYLGGSYGATRGPIAVDPSGNVFVAGQTTSPDFPVTPGAFQTRLPNAEGSSFLTKLNATGSGLIYSTFIGGSHCSVGGLCTNLTTMKLTATGEVWLAGSDYSSDFPVTPGALPKTPDEAHGASFLTRLNASGSALAYSTLVPRAFPFPLGYAPLSIDADARSVYFLGYGDYGFPVTPGAFRAVQRRDY